MEKKNTVFGYIWRFIVAAIAAASMFAGSFIVSQVMQVVIMFKWSAENPGGSQGEFLTYLTDYFTQSENILLIVIIRNLIMAVVILLILELGMKWRAFGNPLKALPKLTFPGTISLAMGLELVISCILVGLSFIAPDAMANYEETMASMGIANLSVISTIATIIAAPILEELLFRGLIMKLLERGGYNFWVANVIQAVFFGIIHGNLVQGIYAFVMGFLFGLIYKKTKKLWACVIAHMVFNTFGTYGASYIFSHIDNIGGVILPFVVGVVALGAGIAMILIGKEKGEEA